MSKEYWFNMFMTLFWVLGFVVISQQERNYTNGLLVGTSMMLAITQLDQTKKLEQPKKIKGDNKK